MALLARQMDTEYIDHWLAELRLSREQIAVAEEIISQHVAEFDQMIAHGLNRAENMPEHPPMGEN